MPHGSDSYIKQVKPKVIYRICLEIITITFNLPKII